VSSSDIQITLTLTFPDSWVFDSMIHLWLFLIFAKDDVRRQRHRTRSNDELFAIIVHLKSEAANTLDSECAQTPSF
jgi:hypothetical protein